MDIIQTVINVNSAQPERLRDFYRDIIRLKEYPEMEEGAMIVAETPFIIDGHDALTSATTREPARTLWNFAVDDLAAEQARLEKAGVRFITTGPVPKDGQISFSTFVDPDGNYGQIFHGDGMPAGMELFVLTHHSGDHERLRTFYRDVVGISDDHPGMGNPFIMGTTWMYISPHSEVHGPAIEPARILVNLFVADVAAEQKRLESNGVKFSRGMGREPWGGIISTFTDPDGNYMQLIEFRPE